MSDEKIKTPVGANVTSVNGKNTSTIWVRGDDIGAPGITYPDSGATSQLGCVKAGTNITIAPDGTISATGTLGSAWANVTGKPFESIGSGLTVTGGVLSATGGGPTGPVDWKDITNKPSTFAPPIATASVLGGVKQGTNITIAADGTISATGALGTDWSQITNKPTAFPPTPANGSTTLGGVKAGTNITIAPDGTISASGGPGGSTDWKDITNKPATFTPPIATSTVLGGVKPGTGLTIDADGTLARVPSAWNEVTGKPAVFPVAVATKASLGGVIAGAGVNIDGSGVISVNSATPSWNDITGKPATFTPPIASAKLLGGVKEGAGINIEADGTINTVQAAPYWDEVLDKPATFPVAIATKNSLGGVSAGPGVSITEAGEISVRTTPPDWTEITNKPDEFNPPIASVSTLGGVKQGNNISIDPDGTINAAALDIPVASTFILGGIKVGNGLTIQEDGTLGTESSAPYWTEIVGKPDVYPPSVAADGVVGGIMPDDNFTVSPSGLLSGKLFTGRSFAVVQYDDSGKLVASPTLENRNGNLILGGTQPTVKEDGSNGDEVTFGGGLTILDKSNKYRLGIYNDSLDYDLSFTNGPNIKTGFLPFVTQVVGEVVSVAFGSIVDAIGYATGKKLGVVQVGQNIDVDSKGVISVKTADKSNLGLMIAGANLNVDKGVVTPALATNNSPGIVEVGSGLTIDANGVLSATGAVQFINSYRDLCSPNGREAIGSWKIPKGVDYVRVTMVGAGGSGGQSGGDANKYPGGGGGGAGGFHVLLLNTYKFESEQVLYYKFSTGGGGPGGYMASVTLSEDPYVADPKKSIAYVNGGQNGADGPQTVSYRKGCSKGGFGGIAQPIQTTEKAATIIWGSGQQGQSGFGVMSYQDESVAPGHKTIGGIGGASIFGGKNAGDVVSIGGGGEGGGDSNGNASGYYGGSAAIIFEW